MSADNEHYSDLPRLRARLEAMRATGGGREAEELASRIDELTARAKRDARELVRDRNETKERFQTLVKRMRELQGSAAEVSGGREGRQAKIRELNQEAQEEKSRHNDLNVRIRELKWYLTGVERTAESTGRVPTSRSPRRWLVPAIAGGIVVALAAGLLIALLILNGRIEQTIDKELEQVLLEEDLHDFFDYDGLSVSSLRGSVTLSGVRVIDPSTGDGVRAERVTVRVPRLEAVRARQALSRGEADQVRFSAIELDVAGLYATVPEGEAFQAESVRVAVEGDLEPSLLEARSEDQLLAIDRAEITVAEAEVLGAEYLLEPVRQAGWMGDLRDLTRVNEFHMVLGHDRAAGALTLSDYRLQTPLVTQSGNVSVRYEGDPARDDTWVSEIAFDLESALPAMPGALALPGSSPEESVRVDIPSVDLAMRGVTGFADEWMEFDPHRTSGDIAVTMGAGSITLPPSLVEELGWYLEGADELLVGNRISLDAFALDAGVLPGGDVELRELALHAPFAELTLSGYLSIADVNAMIPESFAVTGTVERIPDGLRESLSEFAMMHGAEMPESGPFEFALSVDQAGEPVLTIE